MTSVLPPFRPDVVAAIYFCLVSNGVGSSARILTPKTSFSTACRTSEVVLTIGVFVAVIPCLAAVCVVFIAVVVRGVGEDDASG